MKRAELWVTVALLAGILAGCGSGDDEPPFAVTSTVVSHETTRDISVWAPDGNGSFPVVYALHGTGGSRQDLAETATALAGQGVVVFAADYRSGEIEHWEQDAECGYRYVRSIADEYGGDLDRPVTSVGYSLGATLVLAGSLAEAAYGPGGTYQECFSGAPRADVTIAVAGCHYEYQGQVFDFDPGSRVRGNHELDLVLVAGEDDDICAAWQSSDAAAALTATGYDVDMEVIAGANHFTLIFHDLVDDEWVSLPNEPAGQDVVQVILDAIAAAGQ